MYFFVMYDYVLCLAGTGLARIGTDVAEAEVGPLGALHVCAPVHILGEMRVLDFLNLKPSILCFSNQQGSSEEWAMFHSMFRILEATKGLCLPLPPGKRAPD